MTKRMRDEPSAQNSVAKFWEIKIERGSSKSLQRKKR